MSVPGSSDTPRAFRSWRNRRGYPMRWAPIPWTWRLWYCKRQYEVGTAVAKRICNGNRYGTHTPSWPAHKPIGGQCLCSRVGRRLDYIPF